MQPDTTPERCDLHQKEALSYWPDRSVAAHAFVPLFAPAQTHAHPNPITFGFRLWFSRGGQAVGAVMYRLTSASSCAFPAIARLNSGSSACDSCLAGLGIGIAFARDTAGPNARRVFVCARGPRLQAHEGRCAPNARGDRNWMGTCRIPGEQYMSPRHG